MNKKQLIARVQRHMGPGATQSTASAAVEAVLAAIRQASTAGKLHLPHFGTFERVQHPPRRGYDINTATIQDIPAREELRFSPAKGLIPGKSPTGVRGTP